MSKLDVDMLLHLTGLSKAKGRRSIFVTGAASGIGRATCELFQKNGWFIGAYDVDAEGLVSLVKDLGRQNCVAAVLNTTDMVAVQAAVAHFGERTGFKMDCVFNNAGILRGGDFGLAPYRDHEDLIKVNALGVVNSAYAAFPLLKNTPNSLCFSTASSAAIRGARGLATYAATKGFVRLLTDSLSQELDIWNVRAADVLPGVIETDMTREGLAARAAQEGPWRKISPSAVAEVVWACYHSAGPNKIHWFVPEELEQLDKMVAQNRDADRDEMVNMQRENGWHPLWNPAARAPPPRSKL